MADDGAAAEGVSAETRTRPAILVTGTPGVGKTATASLIAERLGMDHVNVGDLIKRHRFHGAKDGKFDSYVLDEEHEDRLLDLMEEMLATSASEGRGVVVDYHGCDFFPERWFDLVLVLRARTDVLYDRLTKRGYSDAKRGENVECEIMQVVLDEARESYEAEIVHEVPSNTIEEMESNVDRVDAWSKQWILDHQ